MYKIHFFIIYVYNETFVVNERKLIAQRYLYGRIMEFNPWLSDTPFLNQFIENYPLRVLYFWIRRPRRMKIPTMVVDRLLFKSAR